jgi:hypothetical protein
MWWEWEGGCGEAAREETPVDFDFFSLFSKPKVRRDRLHRRCYSPHPILGFVEIGRAGLFSFSRADRVDLSLLSSFARFGVLGSLMSRADGATVLRRITTRYWKLISMRQRRRSSPATSALRWLVSILCP